MYDLLSALTALAAAGCWAKVALTATPANMPLTVDMADFDWLTKPLLAQAQWNGYGAAFAAVSAAIQVAKYLLQ